MKVNSSKPFVERVYDGLDQIEVDDDEDAWLTAEVEDVEEEDEPEVTPEKIGLNLPSNFTFQERKEYGILHFGEMEYQLREGQANDALEKLRESLAEKSLRFRTEVRLAKGQKKVTRAWDSILKVDNQIRHAVAVYRAARNAIGELGEAADLERFKKIKKSDLKMSGDVVEENRVGQKSSMLPWFWRLDRGMNESSGKYGKECKCKNRSLLNSLLIKHSL